MSKNLSAFLAQNAKKVENVFFAASDRFLDEEGKPMLWEICAISATENNAIRKSCMQTIPVPGRKGMYTEKIDAQGYLAKVAVRCTVFPNLNDAELQNSYGVMSGEQLIATMLTSGEFDEYTDKVLAVNGFQSPAELVDEAKN